MHEPSAVVSNLAIFTVCGILFLRHRKIQRREALKWRGFIFFLGCASMGGILSHGFPTYLGPELYFGVWWVKNSLVLVANYFATLAVFEKTAFPKNILRYLALTKGIIACVLLYLSFNFLPAAIDLAITYFSILAITWRVHRDRSSRFLKVAFLIALFSGIFYLTPFTTLAGWFTNKDAVHVFALVSLLYISMAISVIETE